MTLALRFLIGGCAESVSVSAERYEAPDRLFAIIDENVAASRVLEKVVEIEHSRLGAEVGSVMPPARVLIFSNRALESELVALNPLLALDLTLRAPAYETVRGGQAMAEAPTLGLDAFCQKLLVREDREGRTHVSFNDLLALADRQRLPKSLALGVINHRPSSGFKASLESSEEGR